MGIVIPFVPRTRRGAPAVPAEVCDALNPVEAEAQLLAAVQGGGDLATVLAAACPLIVHCRDRYGFTLMRDGVPAAPEALASSLIALSRALALIEADPGGRHGTRGFAVYLGRQDLSWFEDGHGGMNALAVPADVDPWAIAHFLRPRLRDARQS